MNGTGRQPFIDPRPFGLPGDSVEITLDLPMPPSTNRLWRSANVRATRKVRHYKSPEYLAWDEEAYVTLRAAGQWPKQRITGPFEAKILLSNKHRGDGDNRIKAPLDFLQAHSIVRNDSDCRKGSWVWVDPEQAPRGCRVILRSLHGCINQKGLEGPVPYPPTSCAPSQAES